MNVATCTLIAQIIPLLLIATVWANARVAQLRLPMKKGWAFWMEISGVAFGLAAVGICVLGVNGDGLNNPVAIVVAFTGLWSVLLGVALNVLYIHTEKLKK